MTEVDRSQMSDEELFGDYDLLPREVEWELARRWQERTSDDDPKAVRAKDRLIAAYMRLAASCAARMHHAKLDFQDLLQEAVAGLMEALRRFDPERGYGFGTFARYHVISRLQIYALENIGPVRIFNTATTKALLARFNRLRREWERRMGEPLTDDGKLWITEKLGIAHDQLERYEMATAVPVNLDLGAGNDADASGGRRVELIDDLGGPDCEVMERLERDRVQRVLADAMSRLEERELEVVKARHFTEPPRTLECLARGYGISRERVRQIEIKSLDKLRRALRNAGIEGPSAVIFRA